MFVVIYGERNAVVVHFNRKNIDTNYYGKHSPDLHIAEISLRRTQGRFITDWEFTTQ